jgi:CspA family cold shock protein
MLDFGQGAAGPSGWPDFSCTQGMCIMALHRLQGGRVHGDRYGKMVRPDEGLLHKSAVERAGISGLDEGQRVEYELQPGRDGKSSAENLKLVG